MSKSVCRKIHNRYLSPALVESAIKSLVDLDTYSDWVTFKSPGSDSLVISLNREDEPITISIDESQDMDFEIRGNDATVKVFIKEMTAEVASIAATELCKCISPDTDNIILKNRFRTHLLRAINETFEQD